MKLFRNLSLGVALGALTAAGALMGAAQPAAAQAPPGFLQLPGTNTSLLITGQVGTRLIYDSVQTGLPGFYELEADALVPIFIGVGAQSLANTSHTGSIHLSSTDANIGFITATHTGWGELQTVAIFSTGYIANTAFAPPGLTNFDNGVQTLLAFGSLGPIMVGLNTSLFGDDDANPTADMMNEPLSVAGVVGEITPSFRYTWKGPNGLSIAAALENAVSTGVTSYPGGNGFGNFDNTNFPGSAYQNSGGVHQSGIFGPDQVWSQGSLNGNEYIPNFVAKIRWDQPWGHVALGFLVSEENSSCDVNCNSAAYGNPAVIPVSAGTMPDVRKTGWGLNLTGHLNTWGKDKLMGGAFVGRGLGTYMGDYGNAGLMEGENPATAGTTDQYLASIPMGWGGFLAYKHFWTDQLRSTISAGYSGLTNESNTICGGQAIAVCNSPANVSASIVNGLVYQDQHYSFSANLIWSPVNNVDFGAQVIYYHVQTAQANFINGMNNEGHDWRIEVGSAIRF